MFRIQKLKPDRSITGLIPAISSLTIGALLGVIFGKEVFYIFLGLFFWAFAIYSFLGFFRTNNSGFLVPALYQVFGGIVIFSWGTSDGAETDLTKISVIFTLLFLGGVIYLTATKKIKWRGREVMELAAFPVDDTGNGYTPRPLPAGKTEFSQHQILEFADFARRHLIAVTYVGKDKVVFVPVMMGKEYGFVLGLKNDYTDETWVSFDFEGNVSVNISHRDYLNFKEALSFDQLCASLGNLFIEFIETYLRGEGVRIIDKLDALGIGVFS